MTNWMNRTSGTVADVSGYKSIYDARIDREKKEREGWGGYNVATTDAEKKASLSAVKEIERGWLPYLVLAQSTIKKDDEPRFELIERSITVLVNVKDRPNGQMYRGLWAAVDKYVKGRKYQNRTYGAMEFKSMAHYNGFLVGIAMAQDFVLPILSEAGIIL